MVTTEKVGDDPFTIIANCRYATLLDKNMDIQTKTQIDFKLYRIQCYLLIEQIGEYRNGYQKD